MDLYRYQLVFLNDNHYQQPVDESLMNIPDAKSVVNLIYRGLYSPPIHNTKTIQMKLNVLQYEFTRGSQLTDTLYWEHPVRKNESMIFK
jgi:ribosomal protein S16